MTIKDELREVIALKKIRRPGNLEKSGSRI